VTHLYSIELLGFLPVVLLFFQPDKHKELDSQSWYQNTNHEDGFLTLIFA